MRWGASGSAGVKPHGFETTETERNGKQETEAERRARQRLGGADRQTNKHVDLCWLDSFGKQWRIRLGWAWVGGGWWISRKEWAVL